MMDGVKMMDGVRMMDGARMMDERTSHGNNKEEKTGMISAF